ncbi:hypothetical protein PFICI_01685 [Pestalotiopsis fici W106-1]|uniref:Methyltransferase domain-containing protein n=1 Tax=Pestalotiopsis fici (strain W106-1 / CGMCC3.15140) TaxID=1229662 RepID=W3XQR8_PESFW|nr:uncharacterized protein PFICI_01685 [Pestalotiopsis fici W106-1]ETS87857.1 hypothetical protein PFICI_01685 [Pestalotiopsis fici W106-1]
MSSIIQIDTTRHYHSTDAAYVLPNDEIEQARLDSQAVAIVEMLGGLPFLGLPASTTPGSKMIDVGCGTGVATLQLGKLWPSSKVYGVDLSVVPESTQKQAPGNVSFLQGDILEVDFTTPSDDLLHQEVFAPSSVEYIFGRMLFLGISDWKLYFSNAAKALKTGAIIEHQDLDWKFYRVASDECLSDEWQWWHEVVQAVEASGLSLVSGSNAAALLKASGFEILKVETFEFSFMPSLKTPNSQAMGNYVQAKLLPQYPELLRKLLEPRVSKERLKQLIQDCLRDLSSEDGVHQKYTVTVARKL